MKKITFFFFVGLMGFLAACGDGSPQKEPYADKSSAVCIWDKVSLRDAAGQDAKWLSAISLGEKLTFLDEEVEKEERKKKIKYLKVKLLDGKEGWVRADFVAVGAMVAVVVNTTNTYSRPDLSTVSKNAFEPMDIIAIKSSQDDWTEVIGKRQAGSWIETAWVKGKSLSYDEKDIAVALYIRRAMANKKKEDKIAGLEKINEISDLKGSVFSGMVYDYLSELRGEGEEEHDHDETGDDASYDEVHGETITKDDAKKDSTAQTE